MREACILFRVGRTDGGKFRRLRGVGGELNEAHGALRHTDEFGFTVAIKVKEVRRFVISLGQEEVALPRGVRLRAWVLIPIRFLAREADGDDVRPAVTIEIRDQLYERI